MSHEKYCVLAGVTVESVCTQGVATFVLVTSAVSRAFAEGTTISPFAFRAPTLPSHDLRATPSGNPLPLGRVGSMIPVMSLL